MTTRRIPENGKCGTRHAGSDRRSGRGKRSFPPSSFLFPLFFSLLCPLLLRASSDPSLFPDGRQRVDLLATERNPFIQQVTPEAAATTTPSVATEESRLRAIFRAIKIGGVSGTAGRRQALLGSLILKPGAVLPPVLKNQFEVLKVLSVDDSEVVLAFVERDASAESRQIVLPFRLKPEVARVMYGEAFQELTKIGATGKIELPPLTLQGVDDFLRGSQEADLRNMVDRDVRMTGAGSNAKDFQKGK